MSLYACITAYSSLEFVFFLDCLFILSACSMFSEYALHCIVSCMVNMLCVFLLLLISNKILSSTAVFVYVICFCKHFPLHLPHFFCSVQCTISGKSPALLFFYLPFPPATVRISYTIQIPCAYSLFHLDFLNFFICRLFFFSFFLAFYFRFFPHVSIYHLPTTNFHGMVFHLSYHTPHIPRIDGRSP